MGRYDHNILTALLSTGQPMGVHELLQNIQLSPGHLHPALARLENAGLINSEREPQTQAGHPPRRMYTLTAAGARRARALTGNA
ncbi:PadR family transcriptional regulator [Nocardiopsis synnemataformans]|uniref:PadR family transcriptional regulator n=1 Tax=Nocardiopsis synnemataformans TaxID=61305 RepID=UPI003EB822E5